MPTIGWSGYILFMGNVSAELMLSYLKTSMGTTKIKEKIG
jgi:hypothetical protein